MPAIGQYDNIGDVILRRPLLAALREHGRLHIYVGKAPQGYTEGLELRAEDVIYRSFARWYVALMRDGSDYVFKPGEIQLSAGGMKEHVAMLPAAALVRARGGQVLRIGAGARSISRAWARLVKPSVTVATAVYWRDAETADSLGGQVMPDLAVLTGSGLPGADRRVLCISMRGDVPFPSAEWISTIRSLAQSRNLSLSVVTQVARDEARSRLLADELQASLVGWNGRGHAEQERRLRAHYRDCAIVVSDRLHVLLAAVTEGATPLALLSTPSAKIDRHFSAAGFPRSTVVVGAGGVDAAVGQSEEVLGSWATLHTILAAARERVVDALEDAMRTWT